MTKIPPDDILEGLYKLRIRESEKPKTVLELYDLETHQKKIGPDYHTLKTVVKRSIEQELRNDNFGARSGNFEKNAVVKNQGAKQRVQKILGDCWQWEFNGQCSKGDNCSFRHDMNKRGKVTPNPSPNSFMQQNERKSSRTRSPRGKSPSGRMSRLPCKDYLRGTCQCSTCTETPTQQSATTQDQHHAQGLALCHDVTLDIVTHRWVPAGHPQYTGAQKGRLWVAQAQTQLTLFVDPQSLSLECEQNLQ